MVGPLVMSNSRTKKRRRAKEGGHGEMKVEQPSQDSQKDKQATKVSSVSAFLRAWAWKREHLPDQYRFETPYLHKLMACKQECTLSIKQKRFKATGFASTVWDSSIVLAKYLERWQESLVLGKRCIELGAGCGLVGICTACLGAASVTLTDLPGNLPLLRENCADNAPQATDVRELAWGADVSHLRPPFDLILATDVIYDRSVVHQLVDCLNKLSDDKSVVFIAYGRKRWAETEFLEAARSLFDVKEVEREQLDSVYACDDVKVLSLRRLQQTPLSA